MELTFDDFRRKARDSKLSKWEKIGFPDTYRMETEKFIFEDIVSKLCLNTQSVDRILDIGCGCSNLVNHLIEFSIEFNKDLMLIDSKEMLDNIPSNLIKDFSQIRTVSGYFPNIDFSDDDIFFRNFYVNPDGILSAVVCGEYNAEVVWWRSDIFIEEQKSEYSKFLPNERN